MTFKLQYESLVEQVTGNIISYFVVAFSMEEAMKKTRNYLDSHLLRDSVILSVHLVSGVPIE